MTLSPSHNTNVREAPPRCGSLNRPAKTLIRLSSLLQTRRLSRASSVLWVLGMVAIVPTLSLHQDRRQIPSTTADMSNQGAQHHMTIGSSMASSSAAQAYLAQTSSLAQSKAAPVKAPPQGQDTVQISKAALAATAGDPDGDGD